MPLLEITSAASLIRRESENVRASRVQDGELVVLASENLMTNMDLRDFTSDGRPEGYTLTTHPRMDGYNAYVRHTHDILQSGAFSVQRDTSFARQNTSKLTLDEPRFRINRPLIPGPPLPDLDKYASVAPPGNPPGEAPTVNVVEKEHEGYPAGTARVAFFWLLGDDPKRSRRRTSSGPSVPVEFFQGGFIEVFLPDEVPAGVTGIGITMTNPGRPNSTDPTTMKSQRVVDIRREIPPSITLRGPYLSHGDKVYPKLSTNDIGKAAGDTTHIGAVNEHPPPRNWRVAGQGFRTRLSYQLRTANGWTAAQQSTRTIDTWRGVAWAPPPQATRQQDVTGWRPLFVGSDGQWYTLKGKGSYWQLGSVARIHRNDVSVTKKNGNNVYRNFKGSGKPERLNRQSVDNSGISPPDVAPEDPQVVGPSSLPPGKYAVRLTGTIGEEESAPTDQRIVVLRDAGIERGTGYSGVSDQMIDIQRPTEQSILNARSTEKDADDLDLDWEDIDDPSIQIVSGGEVGEGVFAVNDSTEATDTAVVRASTPVPVRTDRPLVLDIERLHMTRAMGGYAAVSVRFFSEGGSVVGERVAARASATGEQRVLRRWGPALADPEEFPYLDYHFPEGTHSAQIVFRSVGSASSPRNLRFTATNIALFGGRGGMKKRYPLDLALGSDHEKADRRSQDSLNADMPWPSGAYHRIVEDPSDPARIEASQTLEYVDFSGGRPEGWTEYAENASITYERVAALSGGWGMRCQSTASAGASAGGRSAIYKTYTSSETNNGASLSARTGYRLAEWVEESQIRLTTVTQSADPSSWVARVYLGSTNNLVLEARNGTGTQTLTLDRDVMPGDKLDVEVSVYSAGTNNGRVVCEVIKNGLSMPRGVLRDLNLPAVGAVGAGVTQAGVAYDIHLDYVNVTPSGTRAEENVAGNYGEAWSPAGSQYDESVGLSSYPIPVEPDTHYTFSAYLGTENVVKPWMPFSSVILDADGNLLQANSPLAELSGDNYWQRYSMGIDTPSDAAFIQFLPGGFGDGLVRYMGLQLQQGPLTPFTNRHSENGYLSYVFDLSLERDQPLSGYDAVTQLHSGEADVTHEYDEDDNQITGAFVEWRGADTLERLPFEPWGEFSALEVSRYIEVRISLSTTDLTTTPGLRRVAVDFRRAMPLLTRPDGSEFRAGAWLATFSAPHPTPNVHTRNYRTGGPSVEDYSGAEVPEYVNAVVRTWLSEDRQELEEYVPEEEDEGLIMEVYDKRYTVLPVGIFPRAEVTHEAHVGLTPRLGHDADMADSEIEGAYVIEEVSIGEAVGAEGV